MNLLDAYRLVLDDLLKIEVAIIDQKALLAIDPQVLDAYVRNMPGIQLFENRDSYKVYCHIISDRTLGSFTVVLKGMPGDEQEAKDLDRAQANQRVLRALALIEGCSQLAVYLKLKGMDNE